MQNEPIEVTIKVTNVLEKLGVPYLIGGSLASTLHGMVRTTQDSDIISELHKEDIQRFVELLQNEFFIDEEVIADSIEHHSSFNMIHRDTMFKVDIFIPKPRPFQPVKGLDHRGDIARFNLLRCAVPRGADANSIHRGRQA